jgi:hypothetical protein
MANQVKINQEILIKFEELDSSEEINQWMLLFPLYPAHQKENSDRNGKLYDELIGVAFRRLAVNMYSKNESINVETVLEKLNKFYKHLETYHLLYDPDKIKNIIDSLN